MEEGQSVRFCTIDLEQDLDVLQVEGESLYIDYSKTFEMGSDIIDDGMENAKSVLFSARKELLADKANGDFTDGLTALYLDDLSDVLPDKSLTNNADFCDIKLSSGANNILPVAGDDIVLSKHSSEIARRDNCAKNRELTEVLTNNDIVDGYIETLDKMDQNSIEVPKQCATNFEINDRLSQSRLVDERSVHCGTKIENIKRKSRRRSCAMVADYLNPTTRNSASSKSMTQTNERGRNWNAKTKTRRNATSITITTSDYLSTPVSSPEAEVPTLSPINIDEYIAEDELMTINTKELNRRVKYLPPKIVKEIKHRRRTLKNRGYARSCREKKMNETDYLQKSNGDLEKELASLKLELQLALLQRKEWKDKYEQLASVCYNKLGLSFKI